MGGRFSSIKICSLFKYSFCRTQDCPNGFVFLNNDCFKWLAADNVAGLLGTCYNNRGTLLQISPSNPNSELVALAMMSMYGKTEVYAGMSNTL
jgi:hypothetical protein